MRSIGIDIGKRKCVVCVMDGRGNVLERTSYENTLDDATAMARNLKRKYRNCQAACESTGNYWLKTFDAFQRTGIPIKLANPFKLKIISSADIKTDPIDAKKIAGALRTGVLPMCYVPPLEVRADRELIRHRIRLVQDRTRVVNRTRSMLDKYDFAVQASSLYSAKGLGLLGAIELPLANDNALLKQSVRHLSFLTEEIKRIEESISRRAAKNRYANLLVSIPGIDAFGALLLASEIHDVGRFRRPKLMASWAGMCPRVSQSGNSTYYGHMKKASNRLVNWYLIQSAQTAVRSDERLQAYFESVMRRHGGNRSVSIPHVANKMIHIMWYMLRDDKPYRQTNAAVAISIVALRRK